MSLRSGKKLAGRRKPWGCDQWTVQGPELSPPLIDWRILVSVIPRWKKKHIQEKQAARVVLLIQLVLNLLFYFVDAVFEVKCRLLQHDASLQNWIFTPPPPSPPEKNAAALSGSLAFAQTKSSKISVQSKWRVFSSSLTAAAGADKPQPVVQSASDAESDGWFRPPPLHPIVPLPSIFQR